MSPSSTFALAIVLAAPASAQKIEIPDWDSAVKFEMVASQDKARPGDSLQVAILTRVVPGYHLYGPNEKKPNRTELHPLPLEGLAFGEPVFPPVVTRELEGLGKFDLYEGNMTFRVPLKVDVQAANYKIQLKVNYQLCTDLACSPPTSKTLAIDVPGAAKGAAVRSVRPEVFAAHK